MHREQVNSTNLKSVGYNKEKKILEIEFNSGAVYQYFGVPKSLFTSLLNASSKGKFHNDFIKDNFQYRKIR